MALITSQQISNFYDRYRENDVAFTKEVITATGLKRDQVFIKCLGEQWRCIIYSTSMTSSKVILNLNKQSFDKIRKANNLVSLRFSFTNPDAPDPIAFFITGKVTGYNQYSKDSPELMFLTLSYTQRPPDNLIEVLGSLLEASMNSQKRSEERILITPLSLKKLGIPNKETVIFVESVPRKGILRDLSFSGAKVIVVGVAKFLVGKDIQLKLDLEEKSVRISGKVLRFEPVEGRKDLAALVILFDKEKVPMEYKLKINEYLKSIKPTISSDS